MTVNHACYEVFVWRHYYDNSEVNTSGQQRLCRANLIRRQLEQAATAAADTLTQQTANECPLVARSDYSQATYYAKRR